MEMEQRYFVRFVILLSLQINFVAMDGTETARNKVRNMNSTRIVWKNDIKGNSFEAFTIKKRLQSRKKMNFKTNSNEVPTPAANNKLCHLPVCFWLFSQSKSRSKTLENIEPKQTERSYNKVRIMPWKRYGKTSSLHNQDRLLRKRRNTLTEKESESITPMNTTDKLWGRDFTSFNLINQTANNNNTEIFDRVNHTISNNQSVECKFTSLSNGLNGTERLLIGVEEAPCPSSSPSDNLQTKRNAILSVKEFYKIRTISRWVFVSILIPGIPLTILTCIAFSAKRMDNGLSGMIITFNICEGFKSLSYIIHRIWKQILGNQLITWSSPYSYYFRYMIMIFPDAVGRMSLLLNALVTMDRFIKLVFPLKGLGWRVITYPKLAIAFCVGIPLIVNLSNTYLMANFIHPKLNTSQHFNHDQLVTVVANTDPYIFQVYGKIHIISSICFRYIPLAISITLNLIAVVSLYRQQNDPQRSVNNSMNQDKRKPSSFTVTNRIRQNNTMIVVSVLLFSFLVSIKPLVRVFSMLHPTIGEGKSDVYLYLLLNETALLFDNLAPILNFINYWVLSTYFRKSLRELVRKRRHQIQHSETSRSIGL